jgi:hypothetical protein
MKIESFDQAHAKRCPCGGTYGETKNHIGHRYTVYAGCDKHTYHASVNSLEKCPNYVRSLKRVARFRKYLQQELKGVK